MMRKLNVRGEEECSVSFPVGLMMEGTLAKTGLGGLMDVLDKSHSFSCIGLKHNVQQCPPAKKRTLRSGCKQHVEDESSLGSMSNFNSAVAGVDAATKLPNPAVHLETYSRIQSKQFQSLLMVLAEQQLLLVIAECDVNRNHLYVPHCLLF